MDISILRSLFNKFILRNAAVVFRTIHGVMDSCILVAFGTIHGVMDSCVLVILLYIVLKTSSVQS